jgi:hypothetical protein
MPSVCAGGAAGGGPITGAMTGCDARADQPPPAGPGCTNKSTSNTMQAAASGQALGGLVSASGSMTKQDNENQNSCPPDFITKQISSNTATNSTSIDAAVTLMTKNTINSLSENTNQMVVNSITNTTSNTSQSVTINQTMNISVTGCAGDLTLTNISQNASIDLSQIATMTMTAIDQIRTDLAASVLQQFAANTSNANTQVLNADLTTALAAQNNASLQQNAQAVITQTKVDPVGLSPDPPTIEPKTLGSNVNQTQITSNDATNIVNISSPYTSTTDYTKNLQAIVNNSVTQNFTKDTVNILSQTVIGNQVMNINAANIGGNCTISNISQNFNITLRQTLTANLNIGTSIVNSVATQLGVKTDDRVSNENLQKVTATTKNDLRASSGITADLKSAMQYTQTFASGFGSSGSSGSSFIFCCLCCICILSSGLGGLVMPTGDSSDSSEQESSEPNSSEPESSEPKSSEENSSSEEPAKGGFSFFN